MLIIELLSTLSRITLFGEVDDNRVRRICVDSHQHPEDPDLTQDGHSIGHWEGNALVIGTTAKRHETELRERHWFSDCHQGAVPHTGADERNHRLDQRQGKREHKGVMADFRDHLLRPSPMLLGD